MTTVAECGRAGRLDYWRLSSAERETVRRIETTCRAVGDRHLDAIALGRLHRAARRARLLGPFGWFLKPAGPEPAECLARLRSTLRHPSRTGVPAGRTTATAVPRTS
jgi:hypothetical protein